MHGFGQCGRSGPPPPSFIGLRWVPSPGDDRPGGIVTYWLRVFPAFEFGLKLGKCGRSELVEGFRRSDGTRKVCSTARGAISFNTPDGGFLFAVLIRNENVFRVGYSGIRVISGFYRFHPSSNAGKTRNQ